MFEDLLKLGGSAQLILERAKVLADLKPIIEAKLAPCGRSLWLVFVEEDGERKYFFRAYDTDGKASRAAKRLTREIAVASDKVRERIRTHYLLDEEGAQIVHARFFTFRERLVSRGSYARVTITKGVPTIKVLKRPVPVPKAIAVFGETAQRWRGKPVPIVPCVAAKGEIYKFE